MGDESFIWCFLTEKYGNEKYTVGVWSRGGHEKDGEYVGYGSRSSVSLRNVLLVVRLTKLATSPFAIPNAVPSSCFDINCPDFLFSRLYLSPKPDCPDILGLLLS